MIIIKPANVTAATLTASNVAETDYPAWTAGTYTLGTRRIYDHKIYEVVTSATTDRPDIGAAAVPATWLFVSATNRYKMFDISVGSATTNSGSINVTTHMLKADEVKIVAGRIKDELMKALV